MNRMDADRPREFDEAILSYLAIDQAEAGMDDKELSQYAEFPPRDAALAHGRDFDL